MKSYSVKFKQDNMLCDRCLMNVVKSLSALESIEELDVSLDTKKIKLKYNDQTLSKDEIRNIVDQSILTGKVVKLDHLIYG